MPKKIDFKVTSIAADIIAMIGSLVSRRAAIRKDTHVTAVSCVMHAIVHGDVSLATRLLQASEHAGVALRKWFIAKGPFQWVEQESTNDKGKAVKKMGFKLNKDTIDSFKAKLAKDEPGLVTSLMAEDYHDFDPPKVFEGFDVLDVLGKLLKQAGQVKKNKEKAEHENTKLDELPAIAKLYRELREARDATANPSDEGNASGTAIVVETTLANAEVQGTA